MQMEAKHMQCFSTVLCFCWNGWQTRKEETMGRPSGWCATSVLHDIPHVQGTAPAGSVKQCHNACHPHPCAVSTRMLDDSVQMSSTLCSSSAFMQPAFSLAAITARLSSMLRSYTSLELALSGLNSTSSCQMQAQKWEQSRRLYVRYHKIQALCILYLQP